MAPWQCSQATLDHMSSSRNGDRKTLVAVGSAGMVADVSAGMVADVSAGVVADVSAGVVMAARCSSAARNSETSAPPCSSLTGVLFTGGTRSRASCTGVEDDSDGAVRTQKPPQWLVTDATMGRIWMVAMSVLSVLALGRWKQGGGSKCWV